MNMSVRAGEIHLAPTSKGAHYRRKSFSHSEQCRGRMYPSRSRRNMSDEYVGEGALYRRKAFSRNDLVNEGANGVVGKNLGEVAGGVHVEQR